MCVPFLASSFVARNEPTGKARSRRRLLPTRAVTFVLTGYEGVVVAIVLDGGDRLCALPSQSSSGTMIQINVGARQPPKHFAQ